MAIRAQGGDSADVTGAILVAGVVLAICGLIIHFAGSRVIYAVLPPVLTGYARNSAWRPSHRLIGGTDGQRPTTRVPAGMPTKAAIVAARVATGTPAARSSWSTSPARTRSPD